jgi:hypothetical protein
MRNFHNIFVLVQFSIDYWDETKLKPKKSYIELKEDIAFLFFDKDILDGTKDFAEAENFAFINVFGDSFEENDFGRVIGDIFLLPLTSVDFKIQRSYLRSKVMHGAWAGKVWRGRNVIERAVFLN